MSRDYRPSDDVATINMDEANKNNGPTQKLILSRNVYTQDEFERRYSFDTGDRPSLRNRLKQSCQCSRKTPWKVLTTYIPVVKFIRKYKIRDYTLGDFLSGLTVSFMHLPQAMGFGILSSLRPEHGLYATFFPVLVYLIFGTSPHISFGTNAVMALLTQTVATREADAFIANYHATVGTMTGDNGTAVSGPSDEELLAVRVNAAAACSLLAGLILTGMGLLRFGFLTTFMADSFIGGFTTAAAIHITTSQVPKIFGIKVSAFSGAGKIVLTYVDLFRKIGQTIVAEVIIAVISLVVLLLVKICINERYAKKMKMPIPIDLIVVVIGTIISHFAKFKDNFSVAIVGPIPSGFAKPAVPNLDNASSYISDAFIMAILSLAMSISMAKLTAKIHNINIDDNQELVAYGTGNFVSSFFSCFPAATAPPRTMILSSLGAKTTLNGVPTAVFMLLIILVIGQLFVSLPLSVLAAMIIASMKDLLLQYRNLPNIWRVNKYDFIIWVTTNAVGVLVDLNYGLFAGIGVSLLLVVVQSQMAPGLVMVRTQSEDLLIDNKRSKSPLQQTWSKIFKFNTGLYYATRERFKSQLYTKVINPPQVLKKQKKNKDVMVTVGEQTGNGAVIENSKKDEVLETKELNALGDETDLKCVVLDCSAMNYVDIGGKNMLLQIYNAYRQIGVELALASVPRQALTLFEASDFFNVFPKSRVYFEVNDAIECLQIEYQINDGSKL